MLKRFMCLFLGAALCFAVMGCGSNKPSDPDVKTPPPEEPPGQQEETTAPPPPALINPGW